MMLASQEVCKPILLAIQRHMLLQLLHLIMRQDIKMYCNESSIFLQIANRAYLFSQ